MVKKIIAGCMVLLAGIIIYYYRHNKSYYDVMIMTGATPLAIIETIPSDIFLTVNGYVKKNYQFSSSALRAFSTTRIRTKEFSDEGCFIGSYAYQGIPVFHILEGISPQKPAGASFDQPLDLMVIFTSASGEQRIFSYNEIIMTDDRYPITLAFHRKPLLPTSDKASESYPYNLYPEPLDGLRLICPRESTTGRYLDNVIRITLITPEMPDHILPERKKGTDCISPQIICMDNKTVWPASFDTVDRQIENKWVRIGHGHGYEDTVSAEGYQLRSFLKTNFPHCTDQDLFMFIACDGYRCLFSGREIFGTSDGSRMMIIDELNGEKAKEGYKLASPEDYYIDRAMWGVAYIVRLQKTKNN
ncbi:MAG: hypothetical protein K9L30_07845 [Desulfobacterales bacterium]|nr:hypothetical protein [Desulfobacterales bacterium]